MTLAYHHVNLEVRPRTDFTNQVADSDLTEAVNDGSTLEVLEESDGVRLRVVRSVPTTGVAEFAGMVTVLTALEAFEAGLDLADALHVCRSGRATGLITFDRRLVRRARGVTLPQQVELLT